ncbi:hypothetical protein [Streptomyces europaeiscabiei]|uniref:hypothetical protein n=1 Tax=Streptomyces europaeiscabiei TaxID=146819 RepID=UPI000E685182|nr:hypothetical protein [Streptomyces europaeiscabiei]
MKLRQTAAWVGISATALLATTACGAETVKRAAETVDRSDAILAALTRATDRTEELGSAEIEMTADTGDGPVTMEGTYSWGNGYAYDIEMDAGAAGMGELTDDPTIHALFVDGAYYYNVDPLTSGPYKGKEWLKVDGSVVFGEKGSQAFSGGDSGVSPATSMRSLKYAKGFEDLGEERVDGRTAAHYRALLGKEQMGRFRDAYSGEGSVLDSVTGGADKVTMDVWVGADDLPIRLRQKMGAMTITMDFEKFGATAEVKAPPAGETADVTEVLRENLEQRG